MYRDIEYNSVYGIRESDYLDGAISSNTRFISLLGVTNTKDFSNSYRMVDIEKVVPNNYVKDEEHDIFVSSHGAVANAFDFRRLGVLEVNEASRRIINEYRMKYPRYDFELAPSKFPINMQGRHLVMSTHVLFIKNYQNFFKKPNVLVKK